ncbi:MAG: DUF1553 domain-containing protein [Planctomycetota bacterium]|nr:DUF1553 domain-containing protein [Planctomycetota bacterium]
MADSPVDGAQLSQVLNRENGELGVKVKPVSLVDDTAYLRRVSVDLIGRIPNHDEIQEYLTWPAAERRSKLIDRLMADQRFVDRWTTFLADMLRLRSNTPGGSAALAFVHKAIEEDMPYDEMASRFISANGKAGAVPEVAYVLGDNADPMALAGVTSQVFMGIRISCAECHNHPFDKWTREDFYGFAAYFGKTRRYENDFTNTVYTQEATTSSVLWPPEGEGEASARKQVLPKFLIDLIDSKANPEFIARLETTRKNERDLIEASLAGAQKDSSIDDLLGDAADNVINSARGKKKSSFDVATEARRERDSIDLAADMRSQSELRRDLAALIASPRNRYFAWNFVNRTWAELVGRGIVEPVDDFSDANVPSHPKTLDFLADEFVAGGFQIKPLVKMIVTSEPYQRGQAVEFEPAEQEELRAAFLAAPARRMLGEVLYDSILTAGHLFEYKHPQGANTKTVSERIRVAVPREGEEGAVTPQLLASADGGAAMKGQMSAAMAAQRTGFNLESGIELNFDDVLKQAKEKATATVVVEKMEVKSSEELEAERMQMDSRNQRRFRYVYKTIERTFDDNPIFGSAFRMASPAAPQHFVRIFGQTDRTQVGVPRDHSPSMRQALMMLNGKMTHEASRVGPYEPMHNLLVGKQADLDEAVRRAYLEILTRDPVDDEIDLAKSIVTDGDSTLEGMADLRWVLLNSNEFRYLP